NTDANNDNTDANNDNDHINGNDHDYYNNNNSDNVDHRHKHDIEHEKEDYIGTDIDVNSNERKVDSDNVVLQRQNETNKKNEMSSSTMIMKTKTHMNAEEWDVPTRTFVHIVVRRRDNYYLLVQFIGDEHHSDFKLPSAQVGFGETFVEAAEHCITHQAGIRVRVIGMIEIQQIINHSFNEWHVYYYAEYNKSVSSHSHRQQTTQKSIKKKKKFNYLKSMPTYDSTGAVWMAVEDLTTIQFENAQIPKWCHDISTGVQHVVQPMSILTSSRSKGSRKKIRVQRSRFEHEKKKTKKIKKGGKTKPLRGQDNENYHDHDHDNGHDNVNGNDHNKDDDDNDEHNPTDMSGDEHNVDYSQDRQTNRSSNSQREQFFMRMSRKTTELVPIEQKEESKELHQHRQDDSIRHKTNNKEDDVARQTNNDLLNERINNRTQDRFPSNEKENKHTSNPSFKEMDRLLKQHISQVDNEPNDYYAPRRYSFKNSYNTPPHTPALNNEQTSRSFS
ncbi:metacaspase-like protein, partial [Reticulomyxa filosa]